MGKIKTFLNLLISDRKSIPAVFVNNLTKAGLLNWVSDTSFLKLRYRTLFHRDLNLNNPTTFNEKLQWLKIYDRKPEYTMMVDKYQVRDYIAKTIGEEYLIPLLGVWEDPEEIDFEALPDQFVLKCNHDSGSVILCKDKSTFDISAAKVKLQNHMKQNLFCWGREWPYKDVPRRIIAEKYMMNETGTELKDYKVMCFNGNVRCSFVCSHRFSSDGLHVTFFDREWNTMPFERHYPSVKEGLKKPEQYETMIQLAEKLAKGISFIRVDFYEVDGKVYFGELTFYPGSGFEEFTPEEWDYKLGEWIDLSQVRQ